MNKSKIFVQELETINSKYDKIANVTVKTGHAIGQIILVRLA